MESCEGSRGIEAANGKLMPGGSGREPVLVMLTYHVTNKTPTKKIIIEYDENSFTLRTSQCTWMAFDMYITPMLTSHNF